MQELLQCECSERICRKKYKKVHPKTYSKDESFTCFTAENPHKGSSYLPIKKPDEGKNWHQVTWKNVLWYASDSRTKSNSILNLLMRFGSMMKYYSCSLVTSIAWKICYGTHKNQWFPDWQSNRCQEWSLHSRNFNLPDFCFWDFLKYSVYGNCPRSTVELKVVITHRNGPIRSEDCVRVIGNFIRCL